MVTSMGNGQNSHRTWTVSSFILAFLAETSQIHVKTETKGGKLQNQRDLLTAVFELPAELGHGASPCHTWDLSPLLEPLVHVRIRGPHSLLCPRDFISSSTVEAFLKAHLCHVSSSGNTKTDKGTLYQIVYISVPLLASSEHLIPSLLIFITANLLNTYHMLTAHCQCPFPVSTCLIHPHFINRETKVQQAEISIQVSKSWQSGSRDHGLNHHPAS